MKRCLILLAFGAGLPSLAAADSIPQFAPITIDAAKYQQLLNSLGDVPMKYAMPVMTVLNRFELDAQVPPKVSDAPNK